MALNDDWSARSCLRSSRGEEGYAQKCIGKFRTDEVRPEDICGSSPVPRGRRYRLRDRSFISEKMPPQSRAVVLPWWQLLGRSRWHLPGALIATLALISADCVLLPLYSPAAGILIAVAPIVALHLNRRLRSFTALNSWTRSLSIGLDSWSELYLNPRRHRFSGAQPADKDYHQQKAPVPGQCLESRFRTLPSEKVITQVRIGIGDSEEGWWRVIRWRRQVLNQDPKLFGERFRGRPAGPTRIGGISRRHRQNRAF